MKSKPKKTETERLRAALERLASGRFADLDGKHWSEVAREALTA